MPYPAPPVRAANATGQRRVVPGLLGFARCEIQISNPDEVFWRKASRREWDWAGEWLEHSAKRGKAA